MRIKWKVIVRETCFCEKIQAVYTLSWVFQKYFNFAPMLESRNEDHVKSNRSWDMFFAKKFKRTTHFHEYFKNISTLYWCSNHEMWFMWKVIVRETCFCEKIQADCTVSRIFQKYFNFVPLLEWRNVDQVKGNCSWDMFLWKNSGGLHNFMSILKIFQLCTHARITKCGSREK